MYISLNRCLTAHAWGNLAGEPGFEPGLSGSEPLVLPLNYSPTVGHQMPRKRPARFLAYADYVEKRLCLGMFHSPVCAKNCFAGYCLADIVKRLENHQTCARLPGVKRDGEEACRQCRRKKIIAGRMDEAGRAAEMDPVAINVCSQRSIWGPTIADC